MRRHTLHYYLALAGFAAALVTCILTVWAYYQEGPTLAHVSFDALAVTAVLLLVTWFWGIYLLLKGLIAPTRILYLLIHATLGSVAPLLYILPMGFEVGTAGAQPPGDSQLSLSITGVILLLIQVLSGSSVLGRPARRFLVGGFRSR